MLICGPGGLEIIVNDFDPSKVECCLDGLPPELVGDIKQKSVWYPLSEDREMALEIISTWREESMQKLHRLHYGNEVSWKLDDEVAFLFFYFLESEYRKAMER